MRTFETYGALQEALDLPANDQAAFRFAPKYGPALFRCSVCKVACDLNTDSQACSTGYGVSRGNAFVCYPCCGERDRSDMVATGKAVLYLTHGRLERGYPYGDAKVTNWPGSLSIPARVKMGRHNIAGKRYDAWFTGPDGQDWHGVQYGDNTQIIHCKRLKKAAA